MESRTLAQGARGGVRGGPWTAGGTVRGLKKPVRQSGTVIEEYLRGVR